MIHVVCTYFYLLMSPHKYCSIEGLHHHYWSAKCLIVYEVNYKSSWHESTLAYPQHDYEMCDVHPTTKHFG